MFFVRKKYIEPLRKTLGKKLSEIYILKRMFLPHSNGGKCKLSFDMSFNLLSPQIREGEATINVRLQEKYMHSIGETSYSNQNIRLVNRQ